MVFQEIQDLDSFGHTVTVDEEDLYTFNVPFLTNDQVNESFIVSDNQVRLVNYNVLSINVIYKILTLIHIKIISNLWVQ